MPAPSTYGGIFDYDAKAERLRTVNASLEDPAVWNDPKKAQELGKEKKSLDDIVVTLSRLAQEIEDNTELFEMSKADADEAGLLTIADRAMRFWTSKQELAAPKPVTGPACCCASI